MVKSVDTKCWELAMHFMEDIHGHTDDDVRGLAEAIQEVCEDHCKEAENRA